MNLRAWILILASAAAAVAPASDLSDPSSSPTVAPSYYFNIFGGQSQLILGSEDRRVGIGLGIGYGRPEKRFTFHRVPAQLVYEAYYDHTGTPGASGTGPNQVESLGVLAYARYRWPTHKKGLGFYATFGWGVQYSNQTSVDLTSKINSTPMVGIGVSWDTGQGEGSLGIRFLHISNAGTVQPNQGQNQLFLVYTWRF